MRTTGAGWEELRRYEPVPDVVILLALDRAERHALPNPRRETGVYWPRLIEHLGFVSGSWTTRRLRPQVDALIDAGLIEKTSNAGRVRWGLTEAGAMRVAQARIDGEGALPRAGRSASSPPRLGDPEPTIATALARLREHGVELGEGDAILASPCARLLDALCVITI